MRVTSNQISKAIEAETGVAGIKVYVDRSAGVCSFYSDEPSVLDYFGNSTVYTTRLSDQSVERWVQDFQHELDECLEDLGCNLEGVCKLIAETNWDVGSGENNG